MAVSPADFELYSRYTGRPLPSNQFERMKMAPEVHKFVRNREYEQYEPQEQTWVQKGADILGKAAVVGGTLVAANALAGRFNRPTDGGSPPPPPPPPPPSGSTPIQDPWSPPPGTKSMQQGSQETVEKQSTLPSDIPQDERGRYVRKPTPLKQDWGSTSNPLVAEADKLSSEILSDANISSEYNVSPGWGTDTYKDVKGIRYGSQNADLDGPIGQLILEEDNDPDGVFRGLYSPIERRAESTEIAPRKGINLDALRLKVRDNVEGALANTPVEALIPYSVAPLTFGIGFHAAKDATKILSGTPASEIGSWHGVPVGQTVTDLANRAAQGIARHDPIVDSLYKIGGKGSEAVGGFLDQVGSLGFGGGTVGDFAGWVGSNFPGHEVLGNVAESVGHFGATTPIETALMLSAVAGGTAWVGNWRAGYRHKKASSELLQQANQRINQVKSIVDKITGSQNKALPPNQAAHTGKNLQGGQSGLGALTKDLPPGTPPPARKFPKDRQPFNPKNASRRDELRATLSKSLANVSPDKREEAIEQMLQDESSPLRQQAKQEVQKTTGVGPLEGLKQFVSGLMSDESSYPADYQRGPATHLIRRSAEREANPGHRYTGARGISYNPDTGQTDIYFRASPNASGGTGIQRRSFTTVDPGAGRNLEYDALATTQPLDESDPQAGYSMSEDELLSKSFMKSFSQKLKSGGLKRWER